MAITCIPNQAVNFCTPSVDSCGCFSGDWCTPVEQTDVTRFQLTLTEATGTNLLTASESTFGLGCAAGEWACGANWGIAANVATYTPSVASTLSLDLGATLAISTYYRIEFDMTIGAGAAPTMALQIGGKIIFSFNFTPNTAKHTFQADFFLDAKTDDLISFTPTAGDFDIENVVLTIMSHPGILVKNTETGATAYNFTPNFYTTSSEQLDTGVESTYEQGEVGSGLEMQMDLYNDPDSSTSAAIIEMDWTRIAIPNGCYTICVEDSATSDELESNCINLQTTHDCTHELTWSNDSNHFGLVYASLLAAVQQQSLRICARLDQPAFDAEGDLFTDDAGTATLTYAKKTETLTLQTEPLPEFIHDALSNGIIHDNFFIDGVEYVKLPGDYQPDWNNDFDLAPVRIEVSKQSNENVTNRSCS